MELLDIVDENDNLTGEKNDREFIHNNNLYHRHTSCWILNHKGEILLQRRAITKKKRPGIWSKTGGHVCSGESVIDAVKREVKALTNYEIEDYKLQLEEVDKVKYYKIEDLEEEKRNNNKLFDFCYWKDKDFFDQMRILKKFKEENIITL